MKQFPLSKWVRVDLLLLLLSIGLAIFIYNSPSIVVRHFDWKGTVNGESSKGAVFVLPAVALFVFIVFNALEKYPSLLIKGDAAGDPQVQENTLLYWRILKLLALFAMDAVLIVSWVPRFRYVLLAVTGLFVVYNIFFCSKRYDVEPVPLLKKSPMNVYQG